MAADVLLDAASLCNPARLALKDDLRSITYGELAPMVRAESHWLRASQGQRFALLADNSVGWALAELALTHLGQVNVPLPLHFAANQLMHSLQTAGIDTVLTDQPARILEVGAGFTSRGTSARTGFTLLQRSLDREARVPIAKDVVRITFTSGSTAEPKGVCLTTPAMHAVAKSLADATSQQRIQRHMCLLPLATLLENIGGIHAPLLAGATCELPSLATLGMSYAGVDQKRLLNAISVAQPESLILVPELLRILVVAASRGWPCPPTLKFIAVGGAVVSKRLLEEARAIGLPVFEGYGLSECTSVVCLNTLEHQRLGSVGRALPHASVRVDQRGQIHVKGAVMRGYLGEECLAHDEIATGDVGELDEAGYLYVRGRLRNVLITSYGRNISAEWVESELMRDPAIRNAVVFGEAQPHLAALVSPMRPDLDRSIVAQAVARANERLPDYAQIRRWRFMPQIPCIANGLLTANGRIRREAVREQFAMTIATLFPQPEPVSPSNVEFWNRYRHPDERI